MPHAQPRIAVSMGDPRGIGPEVIVTALADPAVRDAARWVLLGTCNPFEQAAKLAGTVWPIAGAEFIDVDPAGRTHPGRASFDCVQRAIDLALLPDSDPRRCHAVVTGPISKHAWAQAGHGKYPGHTELFAERCAAPDACMMFHAPPCGPGETTAASTVGLNVILATTHAPLARVPELLTVPRVLNAIVRGSEALQALGVDSPRVGVCGLNPHAGEAGLLGSEDAEVIAPAVQAARDLGIDASGPFPADTMFQRALSTPDAPPAAFDLVVAMYHDQGLIPLKTLAWDRAVNWTVGLPFPRTSPDHGTAFDIAGVNNADAGSMKSAMRLAARLAACAKRA